MSNFGQTEFNISSRLGQALLGLLGQDCLLCGADSAAGPLCPGCATDLPRLAMPCCPQCAAPSPGAAVCGRCLASTPYYDRSVAAWRYAYPADRLLQSLKYGARLAVAGFCAGQIARAGGWCDQSGDARDLSAALPHIDLVVAMPLHPRRLAARGFNQAVEIARPLARRLGLPFDPHALQRVRDTAAQAGLHLAEREKNVRKAFACARDLSGLRIAVVDDVMTTGATLNEAAKTLKRAGAVHVENWVAARTPDLGQ